VHVSRSPNVASEPGQRRFCGDGVDPGGVWDGEGEVGAERRGGAPACTTARIVCRRDTGAVPLPVSLGVAARRAAPVAAFMIVLCVGSVVR
jgi:hypothetical protein